MSSPSPLRLKIDPSTLVTPNLDLSFRAALLEIAHDDGVVVSFGRDGEQPKPESPEGEWFWSRWPEITQVAEARLDNAIRRRPRSSAERTPLVGNRIVVEKPTVKRETNPGSRGR